MTDIVERLRYWGIHMKQHDAHPVFSEAADEIERLRKALEWIASPDGSYHDCPEVARAALEGK